MLSFITGSSTGHRRQSPLGGWKTDSYAMQREPGYKVYLVSYKGGREREEWGHWKKGGEEKREVEAASPEGLTERVDWRGRGRFPCLSRRGEKWAELVS